MKKSLLNFVFSVLFVFMTGYAFGQCTPDPSVTDPEGDGRMDPDTIEATVNVPTNVTATIICPDTASVGVAGHINLHHIKVKSLLNKPDWLSYACNPSNCEFPAGEAKCVLVTGTPPAGTTPGYYLVDVIVDVYSQPIIPGGQPILAVSDFNSGMQLVIWVHEEGYNVAEFEHKGFGLLAPQPNPFRSTTKLGCFTEKAQTVSLRIFDMVGKEVYNEKINTSSGENYFVFDGSNLNDGVYFYTIIDAQNRVITKKMIKSR
ncbi:MAG TPA: T9SS type A sorting domain-containing protein [Bacteroidales bacterium]|nr:T9SS type A sorting domain-containing protein [Bacteroidales bacterium]